MRSQVSLRSAVDSDAEALVDLWESVVRRGDRAQQLADIRAVLDRVSALPEERVVVAEIDDVVVGAAHLRATTFSSINLERVLQVISPHVLPDHRRLGVGSALMEAAAVFAEELGIGHVGTAVSTGGRESNRFMARIGLGPAATLRVAPTATVLGRLRQTRRATRRPSGRQLTQVLAARRSMRRTQVGS